MLRWVIKETGGEVTCIHVAATFYIPLSFAFVMDGVPLMCKTALLTVHDCLSVSEALNSAVPIH